MKTFAIIGIILAAIGLSLEVFFPPMWNYEITSSRVYILIAYGIQLALLIALYRRLRAWLLISSVLFVVIAMVFYSNIFPS